jgi:hypothetical protein
VLSIRLLCAIPLHSQTETATIAGTITDQSGAVVPQAEVNLFNVETGVSTTTESNNSGLYVLTSVRPGTYRLAVSKQGMKRIVLTDLVVNVQDALGRNFIMQVGSRDESVTVSGEIFKLDTQSAAVSTVVDQQFVENMPLNGRSFQSLIELTPGVVVTISSAQAPGQFAVNGQRNDANYFMVDGVSANFGSVANVFLGQTAFGLLPALTSGGGTNGLVSVDAMQEFRIQTSSFAPEYGRMPGSQIGIVTKSGSNRWSGTVYDYLRNDIFDARNYFNAPPEPKPALRQNDFGGTVGGPIWKDHTFFFFSYEGLRLSLPETADGYFFTAATKAYLAEVNSPWSPIINATPTGMGKLLDPTCDNINTPCLADLPIAYSAPSQFDAYSLRIDHKLTNRITLFARYNQTPSSQAAPYYQESENANLNLNTATVGMTATISPSIVNDFRANWSQQFGSLIATNKNVYGAVIPPLSVLYPPGLNPSNAQAYFAPSFAVNSLNTSVREGTLGVNTVSQWNFVDSLSKTITNHQLLFGVDFRRVDVNTHGLTGDGIFPFSWNSIVSGIADEVLAEFADPMQAHTNNLSLFGQDTLKLTPRLTLTYGLRWEMNTPPVSDTSGKPLYAIQGIFDSKPLGLAPAGTPLWSTQLTGFAPRFGAAYRIANRTVVRAGFGLFYDLGYSGSLAYLMSLGFPYSRASEVGPAPLNLDLPIYQPPPFTTTINTTAHTISGVDPHLRLPLTYEWNAAFERELGANQSITATYVGAYGQNLPYKVDIVPLGTQSSTIATVLNGAPSHYNALQLQFKRRMARGLQALFSYTLAKSTDSDDGLPGLSYFPSLSAVTLPPITPSDFDIRNSASAAVSYEIPSPYEWGGQAAQATLSGWALYGIWRVSSGPPLDVQMGTISPTLGETNLRPALTGQPVWIPDGTQPAGKALNPNAFTLPPNGVSDDALRNSIRSPYGINQIDLALRRRFNITEHVKLDFRAEYFNILNHPMFGGGTTLGTSLAPQTYWGFCASQPCTGQQVPGFGKVTPGYTLNVGLGGGGGSGGQSALYAIGGNRSCQLTLKLTFN